MRWIWIRARCWRSWSGGADRGDARTLDETLAETAWNLESVQEDRESGSALSKKGVQALVADKGCLSTSVITELTEAGIRTYIPERKGGRRRRRGREQEKRTVHADRRRIRSGRGKRLMRKRGECVERTFELVYDRGGMRRTHLRGHGTILKRLLTHICGFNPGLLMRKLFGVGTPRSLHGRAVALWEAIPAVLRRWVDSLPMKKRVLGPGLSISA